MSRNKKKKINYWYYMPRVLLFCYLVLSFSLFRGLLKDFLVEGYGGNGFWRVFFFSTGFWLRLTCCLCVYLY